MSFLKTKDLWAPNQFYRAQSRYKSLIAYNNKLYICTTSHTSGQTFAENADKFTPVADGGGQLAGTWDMTPIGASLLPLDQTYGASVTVSGGENVIHNVGNSPLSIISSSVNAAENSPIQFRNVIDITTYNPAFIYFGFVNSDAQLSDFALMLSNQPTPSITGGLLLTCNQDNSFTTVNLSTQSVGSVTDGLQHTTGQIISYKYEIVDGVYNVYAKVESNPTYQIMGQFPASTVPNGVKPFVMGLYVLSSFNGTFNVITLGGNAGSPVLPVDPVGKRYLVSAAGSYHNEHADVGDVVEFVTLNDIIVTRDVNVLQNSLDGVFSSLQQQIDTNAPQGKKQEQVVTGLTFQNQVNYFNLSVQLNKEILVFNFGSFTDKTYMRVNLSQKSFENIDCIVVFKFDQSSTYNLPQDTTVLQISTAQYSVMGDVEDSGGGSGISVNYGFDIANTRSLTFRYINGRLIPIGRKIWTNILTNSFKISRPDLMSDTQTATYDLNPLGSFNYPLKYSDTKNIKLITQNDVNTATIVINRVLNYQSLDSVIEGGISLEIDSNGYTLYNINIYYADSNDNLVLIKQFFNLAPVSGYYRFTFFPKHNQLIADIRNP